MRSECAATYLPANLSSATQTAEPGSLEALTDACDSHIAAVSRALEVLRTASTAASIHSPSALRCPRCFEPYAPELRIALALPCGHSLCEQCVSSTSLARLITCPRDSVVHVLPTGGLPSDFLLMEMAAHAQRKPAFLCSEHQTQAVGFCYTHATLICGLCAFAHRGHRCCDFASGEFRTIAAEKLAEIEAICERLGGKCSEWSQCIAMFDMAVMQLTCSPYAHYIACKDLFSYASGVLQATDPCEVQYLQVVSSLSQISTLHSHLQAAGSARLEHLEELKSQFGQLYPQEQLTLKVENSEVALDFEEVVKELQSAVIKLNSYIG